MSIPLSEMTKTEQNTLSPFALAFLRNYETAKAFWRDYVEKKNICTVPVKWMDNLAENKCFLVVGKNSQENTLKLLCF